MTLWGIKRKRTFWIIGLSAVGLIALAADHGVIGALALMAAVFLCGAD